MTICEGYGLTEATCLVSINPPDGVKKVGSVGVPFPHTRIRIVDPVTQGRRSGPDEVGEICVSNPGVASGDTYTDADKNTELYSLARNRCLVTCGPVIWAGWTRTGICGSRAAPRT